MNDNEVSNEVLSEISKEITDTVSSGETVSQDYEGYSRAESAPQQAFLKNLAEEEDKRQTTITIKELKALKRARYDKIAENANFKSAYVIENTKTGFVVELRAASPTHAANIIGWKPRHTRLIDIVDIEKQQAEELAKSQEKEIPVVPENKQGE